MRNNELTFLLYRNLTHNNVFIHLLAGQNARVKSGVATGFFVREIRICSPQHMQEEFTCVMK